MNFSPETKEICLALSKAQGEFPEIKKDKEVEVTMKSGGKYKYKYAELSSIVSACRPALAKHELSFTQGTIESAEAGKGPVIRTRLMHSTGQWIETDYPIISKEDDMQGVAGGTTFARRYGLTSILGIASESDDDGNGANRQQTKQAPQQKGTQPMKTREPQQAAPPPKNHAPGATQTQEPGKVQMASDPQIAKLWATAKSKSWTEEQVRSYVANKLGEDSMRNVTMKDMIAVINRVDKGGQFETDMGV